MTLTAVDPIITYRSGQTAPANGWLISTWGAGQTTIMDWSASQVRRAADGHLELWLGRSWLSTGRDYLGGEIQSKQVATTGTWTWNAQAPEMRAGAVFGMFTYKADYAKDPWLEFDFEFVGADTTKVQLAAHMVDVNGKHIANIQPTIIDLGFDASKAVHSYELTLTGTGAVFRVDSEVVGYFSAADMPGGVWMTGRLKSFVDLWAADSRMSNWAGTWTTPAEPLVAHVTGASIREGETGGAMPLLGTEGQDTLVGTDGRDVLIGYGGDDILSGGAGHDRLQAGAGNDIVDLDDGIDWIDGGAGTDWIRVSGSRGVSLDLAVGACQDTGYGSDTIRGIENLIGGPGGDRLSGSTGNNILQGGEGDDLLTGRKGADRLIGGLGRDVLSGGGDDRVRDLFIFNDASDSSVGENHDVIMDLKHLQDDIDLRGMDANANLAGDQAFLWGGTTARAYGVWTSVSGTDMLLRGDVNGDRVADFEIQVNGLTLTSADVLL